MKLLSCEWCGVVVDADKIPETDIHLEDGCIDTDKAMWNGEEYIPIIKCPVCKNKIPRV